MKRMAILIALAALILLAGGVLAMSSANYALDWYTPLTGGGGGPAGSASYAVNFTIGQSATSNMSASTNYGICLGYWCGATENRIYLPVVMKNL